MGGNPTTPQFLVADANGDIFVTDVSTIRKITSAGVVTTLAGAYGSSTPPGDTDGAGSIARFRTPSGIAIGNLGTLYITDIESNTVRTGVAQASSVSITSQPSSQTLPTGGSASLSVAATGSGTLLYQWYLNGNPISGATSASYSAAAPGTYLVTVTDDSGSVDSAAAVVTAASIAGGNTGINRLINISTRSLVGTGDNVQIAGFIISGSGSRTVLIRASGPALIPYGVSGALADPILTLFSGPTQLLQNDDWSSDVANVTSATVATGATAFPAGSKDAAIVATLAPGPYTAIVSGKNNGTGVALIEVFELP